MQNISKLDLLEISVQDTGSGINKKLIESLGKLVIESNTKLVGMGLTISNYIAEYLAPQPLSGLYVKSEEEVGSTFSFYIENLKSDSIQENIELSNEFLPQKLLEKINITMLDSKFSSIGGDSEGHDSPLNHPDNQNDCEINYLSNSVPKYLNMQEFKNKFDEKTRCDFDMKGDVNLSCGNTKWIRSMNSPNDFSSHHFSIILNPVDEIKIAPEEYNHQTSTKMSSFHSKAILSLKSFNSHKSNLECKIHSIIEKFKKKNSTKTCKCPDILLVDDNPFNILALQKLIEPFSFKVESALSGDEAIEKIKSFSEFWPCSKCFFYKCVLMDIDMPFKDGIQTSLEIFEYFKEKNFKQIIIPCTAFTDEEMVDKCKAAGMTDYLSKPVNTEVLENVFYKNIYKLYD